MANDTTVLRLDFGERPTQVLPDAVAEIARLLQDIFTEAVGPVGPVDAQLFHVLSPRRGSIEFHFRPVINVQFDPAPSSGEWVAKAALGVGIATFLWTAVYGQNGILHGALHPDPQPKQNEAAEVIPTLGRPSAVNRLLDAAISTGADRVEIQLPDNDAVIIYSTTSRVSPGIIGRRSSRGTPSVVLEPAGLVNVRTSDKPPIRVRRGNDEYFAYLADVAEPKGPSVSAVVLWGAKTSPTPWVDVLAKVIPLSTREVRPVDHVPPTYEEVELILLVTGVAEFH